MKSQMNPPATDKMTESELWDETEKCINKIAYYAGQPKTEKNQTALEYYDDILQECAEVLEIKFKRVTPLEWRPAK